jgi:CelD/BcsL family acetyltransferase involved in cellulose biosynthesis
VVVVTDGERLLALFPSFLVDGHSRLADLHLLGEANFWSVEPLVSEEAPRETFALFAHALSESSPAPARVFLRSAPAQAQWPRELRRQWPGGPARLRRSYQRKLLVIEGPIASDAWLADLPRRRRAELRRLARRRAEAGLEVRCTDTPDAVRDDVQVLAQLRNARLNSQSQCLSEGLEEALVEAGRSLISSGDFRLWKVVRGEQMIAGALFVRAGEVSEALLTAFDPAWAALGPGLGAFVAAIRDELDTGTRLIDFGSGNYKYLQRLSNAEHPIIRYELFPTNLRMPIARARWLVAHTRDRVQLRTRLRALRDQNQNVGQR